jgi:transposase
MEILIGIDWSEDHHCVCMMNTGGAQVSLFEIAHTPAGFARLEAEVEKLGLPPSSCLVALETAHNLLVDFLWSRGYQVYVIAPSVANSSRGRFGSSGARTDFSDATLLADLLRTDRARFAPWKPDGPLVCQMRAKLGLINSLTNSITRYSNRLRAALLRYYPQPLGLFNDLTTQTGLRFLMAYPTPRAAQGLTYEQFAAFCREQGYTRPKRLPGRYAHLQRPVPEPDPMIVLAYQEQTPFLASLLLTMVQRKGQAIREVQELFVAHPDQPVFDSLPGAGELLAPSLLVKFGDHRERFPAPADVQALAGTCPVTIWSGKKKIVKFRRACDRDFRRVAQQFAVASVTESAWAAAYWHEARPHCKSKAHAYRCLANRWLAIIWKLWQTRQPYDEAYHLQQRALRRRPRHPG